jgi:Uma2 family endonuclease
MIAQPQHLKMSVEAYFALDNESIDVRYEYIDGYAYLLAGGTPAHALIASNLIAEIRAKLGKSPCQVYTSDAKVRLSTSRYVFPDVTVSCDKRDQTLEAEMLQYPRLVIEILSPRTEAYDRGNKSGYYRACPTIQEYVLVSTQQRAVEVYRRANSKIWTLYTFGPDEQVELKSIGVTISVAAIYEYVRFAEDIEGIDDTEI